MFNAAYQIPVPVIGFTASTISFLFDPAGDGIFDVTPDTGGFTVFSYTTSADSVPAPAALGLLGFGLLGIGAMRRRRLQK